MIVYQICLVKPLKDEKAKRVLNEFVEIVHKYKSKLNNFGVDEG